MQPHGMKYLLFVCLIVGWAPLSKAWAQEVGVNARLLRETADEYRRQGQFDKALESGRRYHHFLSRNSPTTSDALARNALNLGDDCEKLKDYLGAETYYTEALRLRHPVFRLHVIVKLALLNQLQTGAEPARQRWTQAASEISKLRAPAAWRTLSRKEKLDTLRFQAQSEFALGNVAAARAAVDELMQFHDKPADPKGKGESLADLGLHALAAKQLVLAEEYFRRAVPQSATYREQAERQWRQANVLHQLENDALARTLWRQAAATWRKLLDNGSDGPAARLLLLRRLRTVYGQLGDFARATQMARTYRDLARTTYGENRRETNEAAAALALLQAKVGDLDEARNLLTSVVTYWRAQQPSAPRELAGALNNLASVARNQGRFDEAQALFAEVVELRRKYNDANDPLLAGAYNNLATVHAAKGDYRNAVQLYLLAESICEKNAPAARDLHLTILQNLAICYRTQRQTLKAAAYLEKCIELQKEVPNTKPQLLAMLYNSRAALSLKSRDLSTARRVAQQALDFSVRHGQRDSQAAALSLHYLGLAVFLDRQFVVAEKFWQQERAILQKLQLSAQEGQTLNLLAATVAWQGDLARAEELLRLALDKQQSLRAFPQSHYLTLCNLAELLLLRGQTAEAKDLLQQAIAVVEKPRADVVGAETERAEFFATFANAYDRLIQLHLEEGTAESIEQAFLIAERGRSRTLLDQLALAGTDLRQTLKDQPGAKPLLEHERQIRQRIQSLRGKTLELTLAKEPIPGEHDTAIAQGSTDELVLTQLGKSLPQLQEEYAKVWTEIRNASPLYRQLRVENQEFWNIERIRRDILQPNKSMMLQYILGDDRSYVLVIRRQEPPLVVPLKTGACVLESLEPIAGAEHRDEVFTRAPVGLVTHALGVQRPANEPPDTTLRQRARGDLTRAHVQEIVTAYRRQLSKGGADGQRAPVGIVESRLGKGVEGKDEVAEAVPTTFADLLLPPPVRRAIADEAPETLLVVPDGSLHQLPLEALLLRKQPKPTYVIDEFPPIAYLPSAQVLVRLRQRPAPPAEGAVRLLSLGDPRHQRVFVRSDGTPFVLPPLPHARAECEHIARLGNARQWEITTLLDNEASEANLLTKGNEGKPWRFLHLAAHGVLDERHHNLYAALALTPTLRGNQVVSDGLWELHEIHAFDLQGCELAVLSACETFTASRRSLQAEAGNSLAQAMLTAGARRVVASQWSVADASTAEFMSVLFAGIARDMEERDAISYARALQEARRHIRHQKKWAHPFYWAPFVLLGPEK